MNAPDWKITFADNTVDEEEIEAVTAVLRSRWLSAGPRTAEFERDFATALRVEDAVAVNSGTAALHLAVIALGIGPGDEVIMPSLTFVAGAAMTALQGATPVFADVRSELDLTIDPEEVKALITPRTKAVIGMHYGGFPADLDALGQIARSTGIALIEDACHAPNVIDQWGRKLGTVGDVGCFSFFATKNMTTGEGGMVVARDPAVRERIRSTRAHSLTTTTWTRLRTGSVGYDVDGIGMNYRPTEITSAIGRIQLAKLRADNKRRRELVEAYRSRLCTEPRIGIPFGNWFGEAGFHLMAVTLPDDVDREQVRAALTAAGIQSSVHYPPTHLFSYYRERFASDTRPLPVTERLAGRLLSLPLHARLTVNDVDLVADTLLAAL